MASETLRQERDRLLESISSGVESVTVDGVTTKLSLSAQRHRLHEVEVLLGLKKKRRFANTPNMTRR